jgi:hypothetical protein
VSGTCGTGSGAPRAARTLYAGSTASCSRKAKWDVSGCRDRAWASALRTRTSGSAASRFPRCDGLAVLRPQPRGKTSNRPSLAGKESKIILDSLAESLKCPGGPVVGLLAEQGIHEAPEPRKARPTPGSACEQGRALRRRRMILVLAGAQSSAVNSGRALGLLAPSRTGRATRQAPGIRGWKES